MHISTYTHAHNNTMYYIHMSKYYCTASLAPKKKKGSFYAIDKLPTKWIDLHVPPSGNAGNNNQQQPENVKMVTGIPHYIYCVLCFYTFHHFIVHKHVRHSNDLHNAIDDTWYSFYKFMYAYQQNPSLFHKWWTQNEKQKINLHVIMQ